MARMGENLQASERNRGIIGWLFINQVRKVSKSNAGDGAPAPSAEFCVSFAGVVGPRYQNG
jgi:hypothetical protein